jgi:hypothetical protein
LYGGSQNVPIASLSVRAKCKRNNPNKILVASRKHRVLIIEPHAPSNPVSR